MRTTHIASITFVSALAAISNGCVNDVDAGEAMGLMGEVSSSETQGMSNTCAAGSTVKGIDVSYYQGNIDWQAAKNDGVEYAFIRVSDGTGFTDPKFDRNWTEAKRVGVRRGVYQFFRSNQDPIAQANLLLNKMGPLQPGDLPPVIDVESTDGQSAATIRTKVGRWLDHVEAQLGVRPIIYTGPYFWRDSVGGPNMNEHPLWVAHYGTSCPLVPGTWSTWSFHQHTSSGHVTGISGNVDMNKFNGTRAQLESLGFGGTDVQPPAPPTTDECAATPVAAQGSTIIDDGTPCFSAGGNPQWLTRVTTRGHAGDLIMTGTTSAANVENYGEWTINVAAEGTYEIEAYVDEVKATARTARYRVTHAAGTTDAVVNQSTAAGFVSLGAYRFRAGAGQKVRLNDNTGEAGSLNRDIVLDAVRVTRLDDSTTPPTDGECARLEVFGTGSVLNVRPEPNTNRAAVGSLDDGSVVDRLDTVTGSAIQGNTTWHKITDGEVTGFVTDVFVRCAD